MRRLKAVSVLKALSSHSLVLSDPFCLNSTVWLLSIQEPVGALVQLHNNSTTVRATLSSLNILSRDTDVFLTKTQYMTPMSLKG